MKLAGLQYYGGKSAFRQVGPWVAGQIPHDREGMYVEPFAGMLGVLLQRPPCRTEIVGDANPWIANFWQVLRDMPEAFQHELLRIPYSRRHHAECRRMLDDLGDFERPLDALHSPQHRLDAAVAALVVISHGFNQNFSIAFETPENSARNAVRRRMIERMSALAYRMKQVGIHCMDGTDLLSRSEVRDNPDAVIYVDPPYPGADATPYALGGHAPGVDAQRLVRVLVGQSGRVAVSGYGDDWSDLESCGWTCRRLKTKSWASMGAASTPRTECLWLNYDRRHLGELVL